MEPPKEFVAYDHIRMRKKVCHLLLYLTKSF